MDGKAFAPLCYGLLALGAAAGLSVDAAPRGDIERVLRSADGYARERAPDELRELGAFEELRFGEDAAHRKAAGNDSRASSPGYGEHWIYDAAVEMFFDADDDGYYRYLRVSFDVDSYHHRAWVYVRLYLSGDGESWELYHETDDFRVDGASPDDEYEVETELVSGYPPGLYDLAIELYDADTGVFVDELSPVDSSALSLLPLEDRGRDRVSPPVVVSEGRGGGGASGGLVLGLLAGAAALRRFAGRGRAPAADPPGSVTLQSFDCSADNSP